MPIRLGRLMMGRVHIVTDSTADLTSDLAEALNITIVPVHVRLGNKNYRDRVDLDDDTFFAYLRQHPTIPLETVPPNVTEFEEVYASLAHTTDSILSIHLSSRLSATYHNALAAKERRLLHDPCHIVVIDSQLTSLGLGFIAVEAAKAAQAGRRLEEVARFVRGLRSQTHVLFFVETLEYLQRGGRIGKIQALVGSMMGTRPLLRLDDGELVLMEKVRTRAKALERLYEFVVDFPRIEAVGIVHSTTPNEVNSLMKRLSSIVPPERVTVARYGPGLAAHLGPGAMGVVVYEGAGY